jgi:PAS domain S-box-containing protein
MANFDQTGAQSVLDFLHGGGEMGSRIREFDWAATPLGNLAQWPQSLRSALSICLHSSFPTAVYWGPELRLIYNDAWAPVPGERHPAVLGRPAQEVWPDIWDVVGPQLAQVMRTGEGFSTYDHLLPMVREGSVRETYWNYSFTPIRGESGSVVGVFNQGHETTERVLAERRSNEEREQLHRMFDQAPGFMAMLRGPDHVFEFINAAYLQLVGHRDVVGKAVCEALPEVAGQGFFDLLDSVYLSGEAFVGTAMAVELRRTPDAPVEQRFVDFVYQPIRDGAGAVNGIFVQGSDVTEQQRAQAELQARQDQLSAFITQSTAGFAQVDLTGRFTLVNDRFCEIAGRSREELLSLTMQAITHADDLARNVPMFEQAVSHGIPYSHEKRYVRPDGSLVWVNNSVSLIHQWNGEPYGVLAVTIDVTSRREAEEAVRENEARLRALTDNLPGGMVYQIGTSDDGAERQFLYVSQSFEKLTGYPAKLVEADPMLPYRTILPEDAGALAAAEEHAIETMSAFDAEARFRRADGEVRWARMISAPRRQADGTLIWDGIKIDITEHKHLEQQLQQLNENLEERVRERTAELERVHDQLRQSQKLEAMGQLTGGVAHDFNNLLTPIIGSLDLLTHRGVGTEREQRLIGAALESAERAKTLVQRLLAFARRQPLQPGPVDVAAIVAGMADLVASTSGPRVSLVTDFPEGLPLALAEQNQLEMAVLNLCVNARDAMPDGGQLSIKGSWEQGLPGSAGGERPSNYIKLSISDTGTGMDEETAARAVEPFFSTKGIGRGTGLGLSMVHGLALQLGGAMLIKSQPGLGTTIELFLPQAELPPSPQLDPLEQCQPSGAGAGRVLLVDDELAVREATADMLRDLGFEVEEFADAAAALLKLDDYRPDFVVTDHLMPGMSGTDLAHEIEARHPGLPTLIISGYADIDGISPHLPRLTKPFRRHELATTLLSLRNGPASARDGGQQNAPTMR